MSEDVVTVVKYCAMWKSLEYVGANTYVDRENGTSEGYTEVY